MVQTGRCALLRTRASSVRGCNLSQSRATPRLDVPMPRLVNLHPGKGGSIILGLLPFVLLIFAYVLGSNARLQENPDDKLLPAPASLVDSIDKYAFEEDRRSGQRLWWSDTGASLQRLFVALAISATLGLCVGLAIGAVPYVRSLLLPFVAAFGMIPPLAILPILFIVLGLGEVAKIALIVIGITPIVIRDIALRASEIPSEQLIKAQTLGASSWLLSIRVLLPQLLPRLIDTLRLNLGCAWLFLIAAEAIASTEGLGYRIFLVRRYLAMDVILPYVAWITALAFFMDWALRQARRSFFPWAEAR
jgi:NitT/TauT family transport system permease protein